MYCVECPLGFCCFCEGGGALLGKFRDYVTRGHTGTIDMYRLALSVEWSKIL